MGAETRECHAPGLTSPTSRAPMAFRLQSPLSHLGSNDDQLERAQARAARAAAIRRRLSAPPAPEDHSDPVLFDKNQIMELYHNCIKLSSENKINQKNTWELSLIDHLSEIIRVESEDESETNFQKASCTLEAGVKIYSMRVDSVHSEAYKVLGGINRAGRGDDKEKISDADHDKAEQGDDLSKKETERKMSPLSTLESSFEALNVKKFDVAFTVDPLYHQTSAQFDEGGAKGLLLNNLGVYGGCRVLFDSSEVPENSIASEIQTEQSELIDLSFVRDQIEQMMIYLPTRNEISPSLRDITNLLDEGKNRPSLVSFSPESNIEMQEAEADQIHHKRVIEEDVVDNTHNGFEANAYDESTQWNFDQDDCESVIDDSNTTMDPNFTSHQVIEGNVDYTVQDHAMNQSTETIADFLSLSLGFTLKTNAWAGPDHWKYRKVNCLKQVPLSVDRSELVTKKNKKQRLPDIDFKKFLDKEIDGNIFVPPKNPKSLLLPVNRVPCNVTLPEDCHYRPESLVSLFLLPNRLCLGLNRKESTDSSREQDHIFDSMGSWEDGYMTNGQFDDGNPDSDVEDSGALVSPPRQVNKVDIQYDKVSKQVDVHALKETLWTHIEQSIQMPEMGRETTVSFRQVLHYFSDHSPSASPNEISPHLFFICLLHLANEHCLSIQDHPSLDELDILVPSSSLVK